MQPQNSQYAAVDGKKFALGSVVARVEAKSASEDEQSGPVWEEEEMLSESRTRAFRNWLNSINHDETLRLLS